MADFCDYIFGLISLYFVLVKRFSCCCSLGGVCSMIFVLPFVFTSCAIFLITKHELYTGIEWKNATVSTFGDEQWIPFDPYDCPKDQHFYTHPYLIYLNARFNGSFYATLTLTLYDGNDTVDSNQIGSCMIPYPWSFPEYETCKVQVPRFDNVFAYISYTIDFESQDTVEWGCSYYNLPYLISAIFLGVCGCIALSCCLHTCFSCIRCICYETPKHDPPNPPIPRTNRPITTRNMETQPLLLKQTTETTLDNNGVLVRKEVTTFKRITASGKYEIYENVNVIAVDENTAVMAERTRALKLN